MTSEKLSDISRTILLIQAFTAEAGPGVHRCHYLSDHEYLSGGRNKHLCGLEWEETTWLEAHTCVCLTMPAYHPCGQCSKREAWRLTTYPRRCHNSWPRRFTSNYTQLPLVYTAKTTITPNTKHRSPNHKMPPRTVGERTPHPMPLPCLLPSSILDPTWHTR